MLSLVAVFSGGYYERAAGTIDRREAESSNATSADSIHAVFD